MIRSLYTSGWSMMANSKQMDVISNNLANANTNAYKRDNTIFEAFPGVLIKRINDTRSMLNPSGNIGSMNLSSDVGEIFTYYTQGQLVKSGSNFDLSIQDNSVDPNAKIKSEAFFKTSEVYIMDFFTIDVLVLTQINSMYHNNCTYDHALLSQVDTDIFLTNE